MWCNGTRKVWIKTLHGQFEFYLQKYQTNKKESNYFQLSEQLQERFVSQRLEELCGYGVAESNYECQFCTYSRVSLSLGFKNSAKEGSYLKSATPAVITPIGSVMRI